MIPSAGDERPTARSPHSPAWKSLPQKRPLNFIKYENDIRENPRCGQPDCFALPRVHKRFRELRFRRDTPLRRSALLCPAHHRYTRVPGNCRHNHPRVTAQRLFRVTFQTTLKVTRPTRKTGEYAATLLNNSPGRLPDEGRYYRNRHKRSSIFSPLNRVP